MGDGRDWCPECGVTCGGGVTTCPTDGAMLESRFAYNDVQEQWEPRQSRVSMRQRAQQARTENLASVAAGFKSAVETFKTAASTDQKTTAIAAAWEFAEIRKEAQHETRLLASHLANPGPFGLPSDFSLCVGRICLAYYIIDVLAEMGRRAADTGNSATISLFSVAVDRATQILSHFYFYKPLEQIYDDYASAEPALVACAHVLGMEAPSMDEPEKRYRAKLLDEMRAIAQFAAPSASSRAASTSPVVQTTGALHGDAVRRDLVEILRSTGKDWSDDIEALLQIPNGLCRWQRSDGRYFATRPEFEIEYLCGLRIDRVRGLKDDYGVGVFSTASKVIFVLADMRRRVVVHAPLYCFHEHPPEQSWSDATTAIERALSAAEAVTPGHVVAFDYRISIVPWTH